MTYVSGVTARFCHETVSALEGLNIANQPFDFVVATTLFSEGKKKNSTGTITQGFALTPATTLLRNSLRLVRNGRQTE